MTQPLDPSGPAAHGAGAGEASLGMLGVLRLGTFFRLWLGSSVVFLGVMAQSIARSWLAFDLTGSNAALGGVLLAFGVAMVIATPLGGVIGDRLPKRAVLQSAVTILTITSAWIGFAVLFDFLAYWMLLVASALQAVAFALYNPARMAFLTHLVPSRSVPDAVTLMLINGEASRVAGPAVAGVVIAGVSWGIEAVFLASGALGLLGLVAGAGLPHGRPEGSRPARSPWGDLRDGADYVREHPALWKIVACSVGVVMLGLPHIAFLPAVADGLFDVGSAGYGALSAASAAGAVTTGLLERRLRDRLGPWRLMIAAGATFGLGILALALAPSYVVALVAVVPIGSGMLVFQTVTQSLLMALSDVSFHGRIQGIVMMSFGAFGIMALPLGLLADAVGLRPTFAGMSAAVLLTVGWFAIGSRRHWAETRLRRLG